MLPMPAQILGHLPGRPLGDEKSLLGQLDHRSHGL